MMDAALLVLAVASVALHFVAEPWRWLRVYGAGSDRAGQLFAAFFASALASYLLPFKLGIPLRLALLARTLRAEAGVLLRWIGWDGAAAFAAWLALSAVGVALLWRRGIAWPEAAQPGRTALAVALVLLLGAVAFALWHRLRRRSDGAPAQRILPTRRVAAAAFGWCVADVATYAVRHVALFAVIAPQCDALACAAVGVIATFAGIASGLPLGLVGYDAALVALAVLAGATAEQGAGVAVLNRGMNLGVALALGIPAGMRLGLGASPLAVVRRLRSRDPDA